MQSGGGGGGGGDKFIRNVALNLILLGAYFVFESFGDGGGFFGGGGGGDSGLLDTPACTGMDMSPMSLGYSWQLDHHPFELLQD